ncbi:unnamed protein product [Hyaloperonospora brassicae]|uniref:SCP domain-containing protein n=1 Tax=Hyaloperonospora brassicae TaxID=162125 RepID=A0AAV0TKT7_HYABA|nr:unnamed protein product [Hyaloperonospora brassicae]
MVCTRSAVVCASVALVAAASAFDADAHHRHLQVVTFRQDMLDAVNAMRESRKLPKYCQNDQLMFAAQVQANDMAEHNFTGSTGSDKSLPTERAARQGFIAPLVTETVGAGFSSASSIVAAWAKTETVESTMLNGTYNVMGAGYAYDRTKRRVHFWAVTYSEGTCEDDEKAAAPTTQTGGASGGPPADEGDKKKEGEASDGPPDPEDSGTPAPKPPAPAPASKTPDAAPAPKTPDATPAPEDPHSRQARGAAPAPKTPDAAGGVHADPNAGPGGAPNAAPRPGPGTPITFDI